MRKEKELIILLHGLVELISEECDRNPEFEKKIEFLLKELPDRKTKKLLTPKKGKWKNLPDIHSEWKTRGEDEFRLWLRDYPPTTLRALVRQQDFDSTRRTAKWKDTEKLVNFIIDCMRVRYSRGSAFIGRDT